MASKTAAQKFQKIDERLDILESHLLPGIEARLDWLDKRIHQIEKSPLKKKEEIEKEKGVEAIREKIVDDYFWHDLKTFSEQLYDKGIRAEDLE